MAASSTAQLSDHSIGECSASLLERYHGRKNFLLILYHEDFDLQYALDRRRDFPGAQAVDAVQDPYSLNHRHHAHKARIRHTQMALDDFRCFG
ncbi:MAG TPA: hypothetical protein VNW97_14905 [Candidatus Saccharimonadales bacterium]|nr:hypothetical protein [Candidatus Saccharimonadales bacterium]